MGETAPLITGVGGLIGYHLAKECLARAMSVIGSGRRRNHFIEELEAWSNFSFRLANVESRAEVERA